MRNHYQHFCSDWDGLEIDQFQFELICCNCFEGEQFESIKNELRIEYRKQFPIAPYKSGTLSIDFSQVRKENQGRVGYHYFATNEKGETEERFAPL